MLRTGQAAVHQKNGIMKMRRDVVYVTDALMLRVILAIFGMCSCTSGVRERSSARKAAQGDERALRKPTVVVILHACSSVPPHSRLGSQGLGLLEASLGAVSLFFSR